MKKVFLFLIVFILATKASPQAKVDSLLSLCKNASEKQKTALYIELSQATLNDSAKSLKYARKALQLSKKNKQIYLQAKANFSLGEAFYETAEYPQAISHYQKALSFYIEQKDLAMAVDCYKGIGLCYYNMDHGDKAITQFIEGMKLCERDTLTTAKLLSNLAMTHSRMRNTQDAIDYYREALRLNAAIRNRNGMAVNYNGLGEIFKNSNKLDSALANYQKAKLLTTKMDTQAAILSNMAGIYLNYKDSMVKAFACFKRSWAMFRLLGLYQYEAEYDQGIGSIMFRQGKYREAIDYFQKSTEINEKFKRGFKLKATNNRLLSIAYERLGDYKMALEYQKLYKIYSDSLVQKEKYDRLSMLEKQYENERKDNEINRLQAKQELTLIELKKNKQLKQLGLITASLLLLFVFFVSIKYIEKLKSNKVLAEKNRIIAKSESELRVLNASKNKFFSIIAHDLKNPLHTVLGYSYLLNKDYDHFTEKERRKFASDIHQSTNNIFRLLQNLLEWSRAQTGRLTFSPAVVEYQRVLDSSLSVLRSLAKQKTITIHTENDPELKIFADPLMLETVIRNLVNNAIKFTPDGGKIDISAKIEEHELRFSVKDTGIGISEEEAQNLFRIDSKVKRKGTNNEDGTGLGLIICQEFIQKHNGKIWVESTPGKGSEFIFVIPVKSVA